jgi:peptidoglycan L-alanyl-D-glutamate endopeptidase CwlK
VFERRPEPPVNLPPYDAAVNIEIGAAKIMQRIAKTGTDPVLVAAAFNSGGIDRSTQNPWFLGS